MDKQQMERWKAERAALQKKISQLENRKKMLLAKEIYTERRQRNHRLIERGAMVESVFPVLKNCSNAKVMALLIALSRLPGASDALAKAAMPDGTG